MALEKFNHWTLLEETSWRPKLRDYAWTRGIKMLNSSIE